MTSRPEITPNRSGRLTVPVKDGARRVYWEYFGQGDREVVVMLNGVAMSTRGWYRNLPELQPGYDVLLYDYLGQGRSSQEDEPYGIDAFADPDAYRGIRTPTLILTGEQDRAIPPWQQAKLLQILPNARQITLPGSGHMTYMERPDIFWPAVRAFFAAKTPYWESEPARSN